MSENPQPQPQPQPPQPQCQPQQYEKVEKQEEKGEKEGEKQEKDRQEEKSWDEKWRRDPLSAAGWALFLIWIGLVLLGENVGLLARFEPQMETWNWIMLGGGALLLLSVVVRLAVPSFRRPVGGAIVGGCLLIAGGIMDVLGASLTGALALIGLGVFLLLRNLFRSR
jgi:hypothetical protein